MQGLYLTAEQIREGANTLSDGRLKPSQIDDLVSIFRGYLGAFASNYPIVSTFENLQDSVSNNRCAKLAACLILWQGNQFDVSGFAATAANKTGYNDSTPEERFEVFKYAFGLFWDLPDSVHNRWNNKNGSSFAQGKFRRSV